MSGLLDARGCLTDQGLASVAGAPIGQAPPEAAAHLAACARCQDRLLARERPGPPRAAAKGGAKPFRNLAVFGLALLATLLILGVTLMVLGGR